MGSKKAEHIVNHWLTKLFSGRAVECRVFQSHWGPAWVLMLMRTILEAEVEVKYSFIKIFFWQNIIHISDMALSSAGSGRASTEEPSCEPLPHQYSVALLGACGVGKTTLKIKFMSSKHETEGSANLFIKQSKLYFAERIYSLWKHCFKKHLGSWCILTSSGWEKD